MTTTRLHDDLDELAALLLASAPMLALPDRPSASWRSGTRIAIACAVAVAFVGSLTLIRNREPVSEEVVTVPAQVAAATSAVIEVVPPSSPAPPSVAAPPVAGNAQAWAGMRFAYLMAAAEGVELVEIGADSTVSPTRISVSAIPATAVLLSYPGRGVAVYSGGWLELIATNTNTRSPVQVRERFSTIGALAAAEGVWVRNASVPTWNLVSWAGEIKRSLVASSMDAYPFAATADGLALWDRLSDDIIELKPTGEAVVGNGMPIAGDRSTLIWIEGQTTIRAVDLVSRVERVVAVLNAEVVASTLGAAISPDGRSLALPLKSASYVPTRTLIVSLVDGRQSELRATITAVWNDAGTALVAGGVGIVELVDAVTGQTERRLFPGARSAPVRV